MTIFTWIVVALGITLIVGFLGYEIFSLVRDIKKAIKKKKAQEQVDKKD